MSLFPFEFDITQNLHDRYVVYELTNADRPFYLGLCQLNELFNLPDAKRGKTIRRLIKGEGKENNFNIVKINPLFIANDRPSAKLFYDLQMKAYRKISSMIGNDDPSMIDEDGKQGGAVECIDTGQIWATAYKCANDLGVSPSQLSRHLKRQVGHKTVKGMTFQYLGDDARSEAGHSHIEPPQFEPGPHAPAAPQATPAPTAPTTPADDPGGIPRARNPDGSLMYPHITDEQLRNFKRHIEPPVWEDFKPGSMEDI